MGEYVLCAGCKPVVVCFIIGKLNNIVTKYCNINLIYYAEGLALYVGAYLRGDDYDRSFKPNGPIRNVLRQEEYYTNTLAPRHVFKDYKSS